MFQSSVYARVGLAGNPSDGFNGKCLSACVRNWSASVFIKPSGESGVVIEPNNNMDMLSYKSIDAMLEHISAFGHYGALRLIHATCARFFRQSDYRPNEGHGFIISYNSTIPRQLGLGGSSALIVALLNCLIEYTSQEISKPSRAHLAWAVENEELGITAGLQDRVVQTYGGLVYMDFDKAIMDSQGYGDYEALSTTLPTAFIAYTSHPRKDSGQIHNPIRYRYDNGDEEVLKAMGKFAMLADGAKKVLEQGKFDQLGHLMTANWTKRLELYGEEVIGEDNIKMISIAKANGCPAKLPGSGGSVIGLYEDEETYQSLSKAYNKAGYEIVKVIWDQ